MFKRYIIVILFLCFLTSIIGCATVYNPVTKRQEYTLIDTSSEKALGANVSKQIELNNRLVRDPKVISRVNKIGESVAAESGRQGIEYRFGIIDVDGVNAVSLPGGYIYLYKELVDEANDDELACIIAHEVGHVEARHAVKSLQVQLGYSLLMNIAFKGGQHANMAAYARTVFSLISNGYSRQDELEADRIAVIYAYRAGYDPNGMITFLKKLRQLDKYSGQRIEFLSTHPSIKNRISMLEGQIKGLTKEGK